MLERITTLIFHLGNTTLKWWGWQRLPKKSKERNFLSANSFVGLDNMCKKCMLWPLLLTFPTFVDIQFARYHFQNGLCAFVHVQCRINKVHFKLGIVPSLPPSLPPQFCDVTKVVTIYKMISLNLVTKKYENKNVLTILLYHWLAIETLYKVWQLLKFFFKVWQLETPKCT
jgi:hypothetical protein